MKDFQSLPSIPGNAQTPHAQESADFKLVYALGVVGIDYGTEQRKKAFEDLSLTSLYDSRKVLDYLGINATSVETLTWKLNQHGEPLYIIRPQGPFAGETYKKLIEIFRGQLDSGVELVAMPGIITGIGQLLSKASVPVVAPMLDGITLLSTDLMLATILGPRPLDAGYEQTIYDQQMAIANHFLETSFYKNQNLGISDEERAKNFAAVNAFKLKEAFIKAHGENLILKDVNAKKAPFMPPGTNRWEIELSYEPAELSKRLHSATRVFIFTVDVSSLVPAMVGKMLEQYR